MTLDLKRIKSYHEWSEKKLIVIHMETKFLDVESCLLLAKIPFETISYETKNFIKKINDLSHNAAGIIITGSREKGGELPELPIELINLNLPLLGLCYGNEWLAGSLGCKIGECNPPMGEHSEVEASLGKSVLFRGVLEKDVIVTMSHDYMILDLAPGCRKIASTRLTPIAGFENIEKRIFGLQFHPEKGFLGDTIFKNFFNFCLD